MAKNDSDGPSTLVMYPAGTSGNFAPTLITSPQYTPNAVALDANGNIYFLNGGTPTGPFPTAIYELAAGATSGAAPIRSITGGPWGYPYLQVDPGGNIFVSGDYGADSFTSGEDIYVFGATASGKVAPESTLQTYRSAEACFYLK